MLFSFIIPCYNASKYLPKLFGELDSCQLDSEQVEVLFIDDGSSDNTVALLQQYCASNKFARLLHNKSHTGVSLGRNHGIEHALGQWLIFLDCDDKYNSAVIHELTTAIQDYPEHDLFMFRLLYDYESSGKAKHYLGASDPTGVIESDNQGRYRFDLRHNTLIMRTAARIAFRRDLIMKHNLRFDANVEYGEDLLFHWHYLLAMESEQANAQGISTSEGQKLPLEGIFVPSISYYYFQASNKEQRDTDLKSKNQAQTLTKTMQAFRRIAEHPDVVFDFCKHLATFTGFILVQNKSHNSAQDLKSFFQELQGWLRIVKERGFEKQLIEVIRFNHDFRRINLCYLFFLLAILKNPKALDKTLTLIEQLESTHLAWESIAQQSIPSDKQPLTEQDLVTKLLTAVSQPEYLAQVAEQKIEDTYQPTIQGQTRWQNGRKYLQILSNSPQLVENLALDSKYLVQAKPEYLLGLYVGKSYLVDLTAMSLSQQKGLLAKLIKLIKTHNIETRQFLKLFPSKAVFCNPQASGFSPEAKQIISSLNLNHKPTQVKTKTVLAQLPLNGNAISKPTTLAKLEIVTDNPYFNNQKRSFWQKILRQYQFRYSSGLIAQLSELTNANYLFTKLKKRYPLVEMIGFYDGEIPISSYFQLTALPNLRLVFTQQPDFNQFASKLVKICVPPSGKASSLQLDLAYQILSHCYLKDEGEAN